MLHSRTCIPYQPYVGCMRDAKAIEPFVVLIIYILQKREWHTKSKNKVQVNHQLCCLLLVLQRAPLQPFHHSIGLCYSLFHPIKSTYWGLVSLYFECHPLVLLDFIFYDFCYACFYHCLMFIFIHVCKNIFWNSFISFGIFYCCPASCQLIRKSIKISTVPCIR